MGLCDGFAWCGTIKVMLKQHYLQLILSVNISVNKSVFVPIKALENNVVDWMK